MWYRTTIFEVFDEVDAIELGMVTDYGSPFLIEAFGICEIIGVHLLQHSSGWHLGRHGLSESRLLPLAGVSSGIDHSDLYF
jgi:hypothetical protein